MRGALVAGLALAAGCGFSAGGQGNPNHDDAAPAGDATASGDAAVDQMLDAPTGAVCPVTYAPIFALASSPSRYRFVGGGGQKWIDAETDCEDDATNLELATHLVVLDDTAEATAVIGGIIGGLNLNDQWLGATDLEDEDVVEYVTAQGTTLSLNPTMDAENKDCVRIKNTGGTELRDCNETNKYVCECDGRASDPSRFPNPPDGNGNGL